MKILRAWRLLGMMKTNLRIKKKVADNQPTQLWSLCSTSQSNPCFITLFCSICSTSCLRVLTMVTMVSISMDPCPPGATSSSIHN